MLLAKHRSRYRTAHGFAPTRPPPCALSVSAPAGQVKSHTHFQLHRVTGWRARFRAFASLVCLTNDSRASCSLRFPTSMVPAFRCCPSAMASKLVVWMKIILIFVVLASLVTGTPPHRRPCAARACAQQGTRAQAGLLSQIRVRLAASARLAAQSQLDAPRAHTRQLVI